MTDGHVPGAYVFGWWEQAVHRAPIDGAWQHDLYDEAAAVVPSSRSLGIETGTKLYISNLDYGVSNDDIKVSLITLQAFSLIELVFRLQEAH